MKSFKEAADWIVEWTKVKKNKVSELCCDFPKVIESALEIRKKREHDSPYILRQEPSLN